MMRSDRYVRLALQGAGLVLLVGMSVIMLGWLLWWQDRELAVGGMRLEATVETRSVMLPANGQGEYRVTYVVPGPDGKTWRVVREVPRSQWMALRDSGRLAVLQDSERRWSRPVGAPGIALEAVLISSFLGGVMAVGGVALLLGLARRTESRSALTADRVVA